jgi:hypothetical protein
MSGIGNNPPKFVDLMRNKTINFVLGNEKIVISQVNIGKGLSTIELIARLFSGLQEEMAREYSNKLEEVKHNIIKWKYYKQIFTLVYNLSVPFAKNKRRFKKEFLKMASKDTEWTMLIVEQILDYWMYVGKLIALLGRGATLKQTHGECVGWNSINWESDGKIEIKPRYDLSTN